MADPVVASAPTEPEPSRRGRFRLPTTRGVERLAVGLLLVAALVFRVRGLGDLEPNVSPVEVVNLATMEALALGRGPGPLDLTLTGASGLALAIPTLLVPLVGEPDLALRLFAGLVGVASLGVFYVVCRGVVSAVASLGATALLASSSWALMLSRTGELNGVVVLLALVSVWAIQRGLNGAGPRTWALGGVAAGFAWYWHPSAVYLAPGLAVALGAWALRCPKTRRRVLAGGAILIVSLVVVALPSVPSLLANWGAIWATLDERGLGMTGDSTITSRRAALQQTTRSFLFLDTMAEGNPRYLPPGQAPLDAVSGSLLLLGVILAARRPLAELPWLSVFLVTLHASQVGAPSIPDLGRAAPALPACFLLIGRTLGVLLTNVPFRPVTRALVLVGIPAVLWSGWQGYVGWMSSPVAVQARPPGLGYDELDAWRSAQQELVTQGGGVLTARVWREQHPRLSAGARGTRRSASTTAAPSLGPVELRPNGVAQGGRGPQSPRGLAAAETGDLFVADETGRVSRVEPTGPGFATLPQSTTVPQAQAWDLAADADGFLYLADAERALVVKLDQRGAHVATLGTDWGMFRPRGLGVGADGKLYVADTGRNRVVVATTDGKLERVIGPRIGAGELEQPTDVAADDSGRIYVAAPEVGRTFVVDGEGRSLGGWSISRGDTVESPHLATVADGVVAITEPRDRRVRIVDADGRELGKADFDGRPFGIAAVDRRLVVSDPGAGRVLFFTLEPR